MCGFKTALVREGKIEGEEKDDVEKVFDKISWCGKCKFYSKEYRREDLEETMRCRSPFGDVEPMFDKQGRCLVFEERK